MTVFKSPTKIEKLVNLFNYNIEQERLIEKGDGIWDYWGNITISHKLQYPSLEWLPYQFNVVYGDFECSYCGLKSFAGAPKKVTGILYCQHNKLSSFKDCPECNHIRAYRNLIEGFQNLPDICRILDIEYNLFTSILDVPEHVKFLRFNHNPIIEKPLKIGKDLILHGGISNPYYASDDYCEIDTGHIDSKYDMTTITKYLTISGNI